MVGGNIFMRLEQEQRRASCFRKTKLVKKKLNFWTLNILLTIMTSFLLNGGVLSASTEMISPGKGAIGAIKLQGKNTLTRGNTFSISHQLEKALAKRNQISVLPKENR